MHLHDIQVFAHQAAEKILNDPDLATLPRELKEQRIEKYIVDVFISEPEANPTEYAEVQ